jgi:hypothetical protein
VINVIVKFCLTDGGDIIYETKINDIAGLLAASKGQKIIFQHDFYEYDYHILNHYLEDEQWHQELLIYMVNYRK